MDRIDKILSNFAGLSRTDAKIHIKSGRIRVNGSVIKDTGFKVKDTDEVSVDGKVINCSKYRYFMLNKPSGYISSTEPEPGDESPNVISLFKKEGIKGLFPVGRLDKDTTGLLIITNDGELGHRLTAPGKHVDKTYLAKVKGELDSEAVTAFEKGFEFKEFTSAPAKLEILEYRDDGTSAVSFTSAEADSYALAKVTISEGKFHQVKRMFMRVGCEVVSLKRLSIGMLSLDENLSEGEYRELSDRELEAIFG